MVLCWENRRSLQGAKGVPGREEGQETQEVSDVFSGSGDLETGGPYAGGGGGGTLKKGRCGCETPSTEAMWVERLNIQMANGQNILKNRTQAHNLQQPAQGASPHQWRPAHSTNLLSDVRQAGSQMSVPMTIQGAKQYHLEQLAPNGQDLTSN